MKHSVCIIDDSIPAGNQPTFINDTKLLGKSILTYLLNNEDWTDENVKGLIDKLTSDEDNWSLAAFKNPSFFFNHVTENILSPEIIIFDWDYDGRSDDSENQLFTLLKTTYSIIYVYTNADMEGEVSKIIGSVRFEDFKHRLGVIKKEDENSVETLLTAANQGYASNFSYRFGKEFKLNAVKAIDEILIEISKLSVKDFMALFGSKNGNNYSIPTDELASIITDKFKHQLLGHKFSNETESIVNNTTPNDALVKKVWAYRLYHSPYDDIVRKGDIISKDKQSDETLFMVLSSDCHMNQFWKKNFGFVSLVPLHKLDTSNSKIKERFKANKSSTLDSFKLTSLTNPNQVEGITILPGIANKQNELFDYLLNPKEVFTEEIKLPALADIETRKTSLPLLYEYWDSSFGENRLRISEPFLSPLVQFIMDNITGYGCPDFPDSLQSLIKNSFKNARQ